jgi:hypothetical protein
MSISRQASCSARYPYSIHISRTLSPFSALAVPWGIYKLTLQIRFVSRPTPCQVRASNFMNLYAQTHSVCNNPRSINTYVRHTKYRTFHQMRKSEQRRLLCSAVGGRDGKSVWSPGLWSECLKSRGHFKDQSVDGRKMLKIMLNKHDMWFDFCGSEWRPMAGYGT